MIAQADTEFGIGIEHRLHIRFLLINAREERRRRRHDVQQCDARLQAARNLRGEDNGPLRVFPSSGADEDLLDAGAVSQCDQHRRLDAVDELVNLGRKPKDSARAFPHSADDHQVKMMLLRALADLGEGVAADGHQFRANLSFPQVTATRASTLPGRNRFHPVFQ